MFMKLSSYIKQYRKNQRISMQVFADKCGLSKGYISMLENDFVPANTNKKITPSVDSLKKLSKGLDISFDELISMVDGEVSWSEENKEIILPTPEVTRTINIYEPLSCGNGLFVDDNLMTTMSIPESMLPKGKKVLFGQYASGDSMVNKGINDGDLLIFSKEECVSGDVGCFCIDENMATCKTLRIVGQQIMLMPANEKYEPIVVDPINFKCVGKLVLVINKRWDED